MQPESNLFVDILTNLISEGIGILVTVFVIDRLLKLREEQRWRPSKDILYRDLFVESLTVLNHLKIFDQYDSPKIIYLFGSRKTGAVPNTDLRLASKKEFVSIPLKIKELLDNKLIDNKVLENYEIFIDKTIVQSAHIIEPELLSILLQIQENFEYNDKANVSDTPFPLYLIASHIGSLIEWLKVRATGNISIDESKKQFEMLIRDIDEIQKG